MFDKNEGNSLGGIVFHTIEAGKKLAKICLHQVERECYIKENRNERGAERRQEKRFSTGKKTTAMTMERKCFLKFKINSYIEPAAVCAFYFHAVCALYASQTHDAISRNEIP